MSKFLLIQSRPEKVVSDDEFRAICRFGNLEESQVERLQMNLDQPKINLDGYNGVIMGGGPANFAYDDEHKSSEQRNFEPWLFELLDQIISRNKPFLGLCLGFGALVTYAGGQMNFNVGEPVGAVQVDIAEDQINHWIFEGVLSSFSAFVGHKEGADAVPSSVKILASNDRCIQMIQVGDHAFATQFHPELDPEGLALRIEAYKFAGYFDPEEAEQLISAARQSDVGEEATFVLKNFINQYK